MALRDTEEAGTDTRNKNADLINSLTWLTYAGNRAQKDPSREKIPVDKTVLQLKDESSLSLAIKSYTKGNNTCCDKIKEQ